VNDDVTAGGPARPGRGRAALQPDGFYAPEPAIRTVSGDFHSARVGVSEALVVAFQGEDRSATYSFGKLPCPGMHADLAAAFAARTGPSGDLRTKASADDCWEALGRFLNFLGNLRQPPRSLAALRKSYLQRFRMRRMETVTEKKAFNDLMAIHYLLREVEPQSNLRDVVAEVIHRRVLRVKPKQSEGRPGYSDREFAAIMTAARSDVVQIRDRIRAAERLLARFEADPAELTSDARELAEELESMARTGKVPARRRRTTGGGFLPDHGARAALARQLFLTAADLAPLVILMVGLSGRNGETIKELPVEHRLLEGKAVAVNLIKRRRGKRLSRETVHLETGGTDSRQLHTPGGLYLLLHELTRRSRQWSGATRIWSIWVKETSCGTTRELKLRTGGHIYPYAVTLDRGFYPTLKQWAARHGLHADGSGDNHPLLDVDLNRLKTTVEIRITKTVGGHLPSASRTNTPDVSFLHYLRSDPRVRDWADRILTAALEDAEKSARTFHLRILDAAAEQAFERNPEDAAATLGTTPEKVKSAAAGELDTLVSSCLDIQHHPRTGGPCRDSFLTCLRCANALVAERHLPMLYALLDLLQDELDRLGVDDWCGRHGVTWLIITRLIMPRFTAAQRAAALKAKPTSLPMDLLEGPKEQA
jgi:hypothetical protein